MSWKTLETNNNHNVGDRIETDSDFTLVVNSVKRLVSRQKNSADYEIGVNAVVEDE